MRNVKNKIRHLEGAPKYMLEMGKKTDDAILNEIRGHPGLGIRELADKLGWSNGKVDASVNRLLIQKKIEIQHFVRRGILVKKVYPVDYENVTNRLVEIPNKLVKEDLWNEDVNVYAISRSTIGISPIPTELWNQKALFKEVTKVIIKKDVLQVRLPESFIEFYNMENSETSLSLVGDSAIVTIESTIIPVDMPHELPEIPTYQTPSKRFELTKIEKTPMNVTYKKLVIEIGKREVTEKIDFSKYDNILENNAITNTDSTLKTEINNQSSSSDVKLIEKPMVINK